MSKMMLSKDVLFLKTLIEFFDECQIKNVAAGMLFKPDKIIYVGFKETIKKKKIEITQSFFKEKGLNINIEQYIVGRYDYEKIVDTLTEIVNNNDDCCFELTGGKELVLAAMGTVAASYDVPMFQFNIRNGQLINVRNFEIPAESESVSMSVRECVMLNGGAIIPDEVQWEFTVEFINDILIMWDIIARGNCGSWNRQCNSFLDFETFGEISDLNVSVDLKTVRDNVQEACINNRLIEQLISVGFIKNYNIDENEILTYTYKNEQIHQCLIKAGNALELYTYLTAKEIAEETSGYCDDIDIGVCVDWDGIIQDEDSNVVDTTNEIDVIMMKGLIPVFVSCKSGQVPKEALYELETMARHFGGEYSKKILLTTYLRPNTEHNKYIIQRAQDMGITLINGVDIMEKEEFKKSLRGQSIRIRR